jgi:branched-chain amino acid transport system ATP-binding protein
MISGLHRPSAGSVRTSKHLGEITSIPAHQFPKLGIGHVPEGRRHLPRQMSVLENLDDGGLHATRLSHHADVESMYELFPILGTRRKQLGGTLSGWRAADVGHRPRAHGQAPPAPPGRAVDGLWRR